MAGSRLRDEVRSLPNVLTIIRIALVPVILGLIDNESRLRSFLACVLYIIAGITDILDGWLARRRQQVSILGKLLDPLADKLLVTGALVYMAVMGRCDPWLVVVLLSRDLLIQGLRSIAASEGLVIAASAEGKQKTAFTMVGIMFLLVYFRYPVLGLRGVEVDFRAIGTFCLRLAVLMSVLSAIGYMRHFWRAVYDRSQGAPSA